MNLAMICWPYFGVICNVIHNMYYCCRDGNVLYKCVIMFLDLTILFACHCM